MDVSRKFPLTFSASSLASTLFAVCRTDETPSLCRKFSFAYGSSPGLSPSCPTSSGSESCLVKTLPSLFLYELSGLRNSTTQHARPEERALRLFNDLLIHRRGGMIHHHCPGLMVDLRVEPGISDQVDDPLLAGVGAEA
jgi:hypothetical protein